MPYAFPFLRLVAIGTIYSDTFNFGLNFVQTTAGAGGVPIVTPAHLTAVATPLSDWFSGTSAAAGANISSSAKLTGFKLNRIGVDGKYMEDFTREHTYATPVAGGVAGPIPAQIALAITLRTAAERGRASKGRFYVPVPSVISTLGTDGRVTVAQGQQQANAARSLIQALNTALNGVTHGGFSDVRAGVVSKEGTGTQHLVITTSCGRVPDTIRSRRSKLVEDHQNAAVTFP